MAVSAQRRLSRHLLLFDPHVGLGVEDTKTRVVFLAVVAAKDEDRALVEGGCVVLNLRRSHGFYDSLLSLRVFCLVCCFLS